MATVPIIDPTQSILTVRQGEYFTFQPSAFNQPTAWAASRIPPGFAIDTYGGIIYGSSTQPGIYIFTVRAYNSAGWSAEQRFTMAIENNGLLTLAPAVELSWDIESNKLSKSSASLATTDEDEPILSITSGDARLVHLRVQKNGTSLDLPIATLKMAAKDLDGERPILDLEGATFWQKKLSGTSTYYELLIDASDPKITSALSNYEGDSGTQFDGRGELELTWPITFGVTTRTVRSSTLPWKLRFVREQIKNA